MYSLHMLNIILLDGSKGAGKTTVSNTLIGRLQKTVALSLDVERRALPDRTKPRGEQNKEAFEILFEKAKSHLEKGESVIIDCGLIPERISRFEDLAEETTAKLYKFHLRASYETLLERVRNRDSVKGNPTDEERYKEVFEIIHAKNFEGFQIIDTEKMKPEEIADEITTTMQRPENQEYKNFPSEPRF